MLEKKEFYFLFILPNPDDSDLDKNKGNREKTNACNEVGLELNYLRGNPIFLRTSACLVRQVFYFEEWL